MVKKGKKDCPSPTKEIFDPLEIEGKHPATAVLLLSSPEEDVLIRSCEAIHAFSDRGDENKVSLLRLGALEPLCQLINHGNKMVRRNAFMALGVMSTNAEVKNVLKKMNVIPSIINKLTPQEETVVHEFGTLCLASLSEDFSCKALIFDNNGLLSVIQLLSSPDPDVVKNSLEIIYNQIHDYPSRLALHQLGGIPHFLTQLQSEYPVIQQLSVKILQNITTDKDTRIAFREEQGFEKCIDILRNKDLHDLHAGSLQVVENCLNDSEYFQLIHKGGGLAQLMEFMVSSTMPETQANAVKCIARVAQSSENRRMLHEQHLEKVLLELLSVNDDNVKAAASQAVSSMSSNLSSKEMFRELGAISALVQSLSSETLAVKRDASRALSDLTHNNLLNVKAVYEAGGHELLVPLLSEECPTTVASSATTLSNMAGQEDIRYSVLSQNVLPSLVKALKSKDSHVQMSAALCVAALVCDTNSRTEFKNAGGLQYLVHLLDSKNRDVKEMACLAVKACACDEPCAVEMCVLGSLEKLQKINQSENQKQVSTEMAITSLLNFNLPVKYSLMGFLSPTDHVTDGFYDPGKAAAGCRVLSLEEHYCQPVNHLRPVILINTAKNEKKMDPVSVVHTDKLCRDTDAALEALVQNAKKTVLFLGDDRKQYSTLAKMVSQAMGGEVDREKIHTFEWNLHISKLQLQLQSNVVPIGMIKQGTYYHRALLFKALKSKDSHVQMSAALCVAALVCDTNSRTECLADSIGLSSSLVRGEYHCAWNEVLMMNGQTHVVDLMHSPGRLLKVNTPPAEQYQHIKARTFTQ